MRNFKNFRSTKDEYFNEESDAAFGVGGRTAGTSPSKSFYMSAKDFLFSESLNLVDTAINIPEIQPIILNEFQPDNQVYWVKGLASIGKSFFDVAKNGESDTSKVLNFASSIFGSSFGTFAVGAGKAIAQNMMITRYSLDPSKLYGKNADLGDLSPINTVRNMFKSGRWLNTYELPFFGANSNTYLIANQFDKWQTGRHYTNVR